MTISTQLMKITPKDIQLKGEAGKPIDTAFTVQNMSDRRVRVEALLEPLAGPENLGSEPLPAAAWDDWLTLDEPREVAFAVNGVRDFTAHITLPERVRLGAYQFRLLIVGIDDPDRDVVRSKPVTLTVTGPEIDMGPIFRWALVAGAFIVLLLIGVIITILIQSGKVAKMEEMLEAHMVAAAAMSDTVLAGQWIDYSITISNMAPVPTPPKPSWMQSLLCPSQTPTSDANWQFDPRPKLCGMLYADTLTVTNKLTTENTITTLALFYTLPKGVTAATVRKPLCKDADAATRCWELDDDLKPGAAITIPLSVLVGSDALVIDNSDALAVRFEMNGKSTEVPVTLYANAKVNQVLPADAIYVPPELPAAQKALSDAWLARNAMGIDSTAARDKAVAARQTLSTTLWSLSNVAVKEIDVIHTEALEKLGNNLQGLSEDLDIQKLQVADIITNTITKVNKATKISRTIPSEINDLVDSLQTKYDAARSLVDLWQEVAEKPITVTDVIIYPLEFTEAKAASKKLSDFNNPLSEWPPLQTLIALSGLEQAEKELAGSSTNQQYVDDVRAARDTLAKTLPALESWLQTQPLDEKVVGSLTATMTQTVSLTSEERKTVYPLLALHAVQDLQWAMEVLVAEDRVNAAQEQIDKINNAKAEDSKAAAEQAANTRQQRMAEAAQQSASDRPPLEMDGWQDLYASVAALQDHEVALQWLATARLTAAVDDATGAVLTAAKKHAVERQIGPFLDALLGIQTPLKSLQDTARPEALLAAQLALKTPKAAAVDQAQRKLQDALAEQERSTKAVGKTELRKEILENYNAYLDLVNAQVNTAKAQLEQALAAQQAESEPAGAAAAIPPALVEALAQQIADAVTKAVVAKSNQVDFLKASAQQMLAVEQAIHLDVKSQLSRALVAVQRPTRVRLFYDAEYAIQQLDKELASGRYSYTERTRKALLRTALADLQLALRHVLAVPATQQPPGADFQTVIQQIADESSQGATMTTLLEELQDALDQTKLALRAQGDSASTSS